MDLERINSAATGLTARLERHAARCLTCPRCGQMAADGYPKACWQTADHRPLCDSCKQQLRIDALTANWSRQRPGT